jgi:hypothetical protein
MQNDALHRAGLKRTTAALCRDTAPYLSLRRDREVFLRHAVDLEREAEKLERASKSTPARYH